MKKLIVVLMLGSLWLFSCGGPQETQDTNTPIDEGNDFGDTMEQDMDTTLQDTIGMGGGI